jgi:hypothetical protein
MWFPSTLIVIGGRGRDTVGQRPLENYPGSLTDHGTNRYCNVDLIESSEWPRRALGPLPVARVGVAPDGGGWFRPSSARRADPDGASGSDGAGGGGRRPDDRPLTPRRDDRGPAPAHGPLPGHHRPGEILGKAKFALVLWCDPTSVNRLPSRRSAKLPFGRR